MTLTVLNTEKLCADDPAEWRMDPQSAVEAPRVASTSRPESALPHAYHAKGAVHLRRLECNRL
jgi:hypothetical protein